MYWLKALVIATLPLLLGEGLYKIKLAKAESARKIVHILGAASAVLLTLVLDLHQIAILTLCFTAILIIIRKARLVRALYDIKRRSFGEVLFPAGISATALVAQNIPSYVFGMLVLGLADAGASLIGSKYGRQAFKPLFGKDKKTYIGSFTFFVITFVTGVYFLLFYQNAATSSLAIVLLGSVTLTFVESQLSYGLDNFIVPILSATLIQVVLS